MNISARPVLATILLTAALAAPCALHAQDYAVQVGDSNTTINVDLLGLAPSTTVYEALRTLPELLNRPGSQLLTNFSMKVNGVSVGDMDDAFLSQLRIADVKKIQVEESSTSSFSNNGEGGSINIVLADSVENISGNITLDVAYPLDIIPGALLSFNKGKWNLTSLVKADYYDPSSSTVKYKDGDDPEVEYDSDTRYIGQTAHLLAVRTGAHDKLTLSAAEFCSLASTLENSTDNREREYKLLAHAKYERNFNTGGTFMVEKEYSFAPTNYIFNGSENKTATHQAVGQVEYSRPVYSRDGNSVVLKMGLNGSYTYMTPVFYGLSDVPEFVDVERSTFAMPYFKATSHLGRWRFLAELNGQYFGQDYGHDDVYKRKGEHFDMVGLFSTSWQFTDHQMIRLKADRKIMRQNSNTYNPVKLEGVELDYITDGSFGIHSWILNVSGGYIHVNDIFATKENNYDVDDILNFDLLARYQVGIFTMSFTANCYHCMFSLEGKRVNHGTYYNLSLMPSLNFKNDFHITASVVYNSKVYRYLAQQGAACYSRLVVGKDWGPVNVHVYGLLNLLGKTTDIRFDHPYGFNPPDGGDDDGTGLLGNSYTTYSLIRNTVGIGLRYSF